MAKKKATKKKAPKKIRKGMGVYTVKQATSIQGKLDKRITRVVRERQVMTNAYADEMNDNYDTTGKFAELDEKATAEYEKAAIKKGPKETKEQKAEREAKAQAEKYDKK